MITLKNTTVLERIIVSAIVLIFVGLLLNGCAYLDGEENRSSVSVYKLGLSGQYAPIIDTIIGGYRLEMGGNPSGVNFHYQDGSTTIDVVKPSLDGKIPDATVTTLQAK